MSQQPHCPKCSTQLPANAPAGLCPKCLVQAGLESEPGPHPRPAATVSIAAFSGFEPLSVTSLAGKFPQLEILELLGKGGMGAVYKARQRGLDRLVAVKVLPPEIGHDSAFAERFTREARALARLSHNHIVSVFDFGQSDGLFYIVMEYVDGVNLRQTIQTGKLTPAEALAIVPQICEALQFAHDEGIVHRDIKPENILIDKRGRVKIADFGLAKLLGQDAGDHLLTATHQVMGTLRYMAPEQMQGSREVDHRADIYSLGVIFYELLTGELPMGKFPPPSRRVQVDVRLDEIVLRALEQQPEQRYQHASELKNELDSMRTMPGPIPKPATERDSLEGFRELARFSMTPSVRYGQRVGIPMLILFAVWLAATITVHVLFGQRSNYQEGPILLIQGGGMILFGFVAFVMHLVFFARERGAHAGARQTLPSDFLPVAYQAASSEPRFSRFAILGAVWALFGVLTILPILFFIGLNRVWNGTALPTDVIYEQPPLVFTIFMGALLAIGAGAPIGTTIYGAIAIGHIKRSGGKIIGLPLAVADALFFPLLLLAAAAGLAGIVILRGPLQLSGLDQQIFTSPLQEVLMSLIAVPIWFFPARALWRAVSGRKDAFALPRIPLVATESLVGQAGLVIAVAACAAHAWPWEWIAPPNTGFRVLSNFDDIRAMQSLLALALAIGAALFAAAPGLTLPVRRIIRGAAVIGGGAALALQIQFYRSLGELEPGSTVVRLTRSFPQMGLYAAIALTSLAILFFVLRLCEEKQ